MEKIINAGNLPDTKIKLFLSKLDRQGDCWVWTSTVFKVSGIPTIKFQIDSGTWRSGRCVAYELFKGPVKPGQLLRMACRNKLCLNPGHMIFSKPRPHIVFDALDTWRFWSKVDKTPNPTGCWEWTGGIDRGGYGTFHIGKTDQKAHVAGYVLQTGKQVPDGTILRHTCDNKKCVRADHLLPGSHLENGNDKKVRGRSHVPAGDKNKNAKLNPDIIRAIRADRATGMKLKDVAVKYGVSIGLVGKINARQLWNHVPDDPNAPVDLTKRNKVYKRRYEKLTPEDIRAIRAARKAGEKYKDIAARFDISTGVVANIVARRLWADLSDEAAPNDPTNYTEELKAVVTKPTHRADGWPLCPQCSADELMSAEVNPKPTDRLICLACHWKGEVPPTVIPPPPAYVESLDHLKQMPPPTPEEVDTQMKASAETRTRGAQVWTPGLEGARDPILEDKKSSETHETLTNTTGPAIHQEHEEVLRAAGHLPEGDGQEHAEIMEEIGH